MYTSNARCKVSCSDCIISASAGVSSAGLAPGCLSGRLVSRRTLVRYRFGSPFSLKGFCFVDTDL